MAKKFFRYVPDFDYVSRLSKAQNISDYIRVKNLFKRTKISEEIFSDLTFFTKSITCFLLCRLFILFRTKSFPACKLK